MDVTKSIAWFEQLEIYISYCRTRKSISNIPRKIDNITYFYRWFGTNISISK